MKEALGRFRLWLLGWYFAVSALALLGFGGAAYWVFEVRLLKETDQLLLQHLDGAGSPGDGVRLFQFDERGEARDPLSGSEWLRPYARETAGKGSVQATLRVDEDREEGGEESEVEHFWRILGRADPGGVEAQDGEARRVVLAVLDLQSFRERTADLLTALALAGAAALLRVGGGGYVLSRRAMAPAEVAYEGMKRFTGDVAHEIRTPLQIIRGQVDVALQQPRDPDAYRDALKVVGFEAQRLAHVVDGLLTLARAEAGASSIVRHTVQISDLIFDTLPSAQRLAIPAQMTVNVEVEGDPRVGGDPVLLRQALLILLDNAVRYGPRGSRVLLRGRVEGEEVLLEVEDEGPGVPVAARERFLERFQGDRGEGRMGLGLAIVRWIAEAHGGGVAILDAPSGGARVRITLPQEQTST
jgi:signal transduction histidine kinase